MADTGIDAERVANEAIRADFAKLITDEFAADDDGGGVTEQGGAAKAGNGAGAAPSTTSEAAVGASAPGGAPSETRPTASGTGADPQGLASPASQPGAPTPATDKPAEAKPGDTPSAQAPVEAKATPPSGTAPEHWHKEDREAFARLPQDAQTIVRQMSERMETAHHERTRAFAPYRAIAERYAPLAEELAPYRSQLQLQGIDEVGFLRSLLGAHNLLVSKPQEAIKWIVNRYGIDLRAVVEAATDVGSTPDDMDPLRPVVSQVQKLNERLGKIEGQTAAQVAATRQASQANGEKIVSDFITGKDDKGIALRPHWNEVKTDVLMLARAAIAGGEAINAAKLQDLYDKACWANPTVRPKMMRGQIDADTARRQAEAQRAKDATTTVKTRSQAGSPKPDETFREELGRTIREAGIVPS